MEVVMSYPREIRAASAYVALVVEQPLARAFIHVGTRHVCCSPFSFTPDPKWMVGQAHAFIEHAREARLGVQHLDSDRDEMYVREFDQVFKEVDCKVIPTALQLPNQNAFIERWNSSVCHS
jgi:hypothetical protein